MVIEQNLICAHGLQLGIANTGFQVMVKQLLLQKTLKLPMPNLNLFAD